MTQKPEKQKPFVIFGKFENTAGEQVLEQWTGHAQKMSTAMRRALLDFWQRKSVRWRHHTLVVLSAQPLTEAEYRARTSKKKARAA